MKQTFVFYDQFDGIPRYKSVISGTLFNSRLIIQIRDIEENSPVYQIDSFQYEETFL